MIDWRRKHGMASSPEYRAWADMRQRCYNAKHRSYAYYGGRGISVCDRWASFEAFFADMGSRPAGTSLDRKDNAGNYEPDNCRWSTQATQMRNTRYTRLFTIDGTTMCLTDWALARGQNANTVTWRLRRGWSLNDALAGRRSA